MKKLIIIFLLLLSGTSYASLTVNNVPQTKTGGSSPAVKDSSIWQVNGNVGIGSPNPGQALDVKGTVRATAFIGSIPSSSISGVIPISNLATGTPTGSKFIRDDGTLQVPAGGGGSGSSLWETNSIGIDTFNPVGIGSTSPTQALDVQGTIRSLSQFVNGNVGINTLSSTPIVQVTGGGIAGESVNKGYELILPSPNFGGGTTEVDSFLNYKGNLLVCFNEPNSALWTFDGNKYKLLHKFGSSHGQCDAIESYQGKLYAALVGNGGLNGSVQVSSDDGQTWSDSYLSSQDFDLYSLGVFKGKLYAGAGYLNSRIYSFDGTTWTQIYNGFPGGTAGLVQFLYVYKGLLFAGISNGAGGGVISSPDGTNFTTELNGISVTRFAEFRGHLYATTQAGGGNPNVYIRNDSTGTWTALTAILASQCWAVLPYNNALYVGCTDNTNGGLVYKSYDGFNFTLDFTNNYAGGKGTEPFAMYNYNGSLYIGMGFNGGAVADVWRKTDSIGQQTDWLNNFENTFRNNTYNGYNWPNDRSLISTTSPWDFDSNVGIGTGAPGQVLDVQGTIRTTGFIYTTKPTSGYVLTTNSVGVGTWAPVSASGGGSGTVTSIGVSSPNSTLTIGSSPVTTSGTITGDINLTNANTWTGQQVFNTANVGIGSASPGKALDVQGTVRSLGFTTNGAYIQSGTSANTFTGTPTFSNATNSALFTGGNVGVGLTNPASAFELATTGKFLISNDSTHTTGGTYELSAGSSGGVSVFSASYWGGSAPDLLIHTNDGGNQIYLKPSGNVGIGTVTPKGLFEVGVQKFDVLSGGNVGIGSITPGQILDVKGTIRSSLGAILGGTSILGTSALTVNSTSSNDQTAAFTANVAGSSGGAGMVGYVDANTAVVSGDRLGYLFFGGATDSVHTVARPTGIDSFADENWSGSANGSDIRLFTTPNTTTSRTERFRIDNSGNVGIGSASPGNQLDVQGTVRAVSFAKFGGTSSQFFKADGSVDSTTYGTGSGTVNSGTSGQAAYYASSTTAVSSNSDLVFNGSNIGIGTTTTTENLIVGNDLGNITTGNVAVVGNLSGNSSFAIGQGNNNNAAVRWVYNATPSNGSMRINTAAYNNPIYLDASAMYLGSQNPENIGIGTSSPGSGLSILSNESIGSYATSSAPTGGLIVSGNVGIGTVNPGQILDIVGTVRFTNSLLNTKSTTGIGWTNKAGTNTACNTTCGTSACVIGIDTGTVGVLNSNFVACNDATADDCLCAGP